jgi:integrase
LDSTSLPGRRIGRSLPVATADHPLAQIEYAFERRAILASASSKGGFATALSYYKQYLDETNRGGPASLRALWGRDEFVNFQLYVESLARGRGGKTLATATVQSICSKVFATMTWAFENAYIEARPDFLSRPKAARETKSRAAYTDEEVAKILQRLQPNFILAQRMSTGYLLQNIGVDPRVPLMDYHANLVWYFENVLDFGCAPHANWRTKHDRFYSAVDRLHGCYEAFRSKVAATHEGDATVPHFRTGIGEDPRPRRGAWLKTENLVWYFENVLNCQILDGRELESRHLKFLRAVRETHGGDYTNFYRRVLGVSNRIDSHVIVPLAVKLACETGLNVESLLSLERDCFVESESLTGLPHLNYYKERGEGEAVYPLLHKEMLPLKQRQSQAVRSTIQQLLKLTGELLPSAPMDAKKLLFLVTSGGTSAPTVQPLNRRHVNTFLTATFRGEMDGGKALSSINLSRFRPTLVTRLLKLGLDVHEISALLGHRDVETTIAYLDLHQIVPVFENAVRHHLDVVKENARAYRTVPIQPVAAPGASDAPYLTGGMCLCKNPYAPPKRIQLAKGFMEGKPCTYYDICLTCDHVVVTDLALPRLANYRTQIRMELEQGLANEPRKGNLYSRSLSVLDFIFTSDQIFTTAVLENAHRLAKSNRLEVLDEFLHG